MSQSNFDHTQNRITGFQNIVRESHNQPVENTI